MIIVFTILLTVSTLNAATTTCDESLKPNPDKQCSICHFSWVDTFFIDKKNSELAVIPEDKAVSSPEMCFSCHDGSTVDYRKKLLDENKHKVGSTPSENMKIPEIFPLDEEGKMQCSTCHTAHCESRDYNIEKTIFLRTSNKNSRMCMMCHADKVGGTEKGNHPVDKTSLKIPDEIIKYGGYTGDEKNQVICESCHVAHGGFSDNRLVMPADQPSAYPVLCEQCHGIKPGLSKNNIRNSYSHSVDMLPENLEIPKKWTNGDDLRLDSTGRLLCVSCHSVHKPVVNDSLLSAKNESDSMCVHCHSSQGKAILNTKHDLKMMSPNSENILGKTASQSGICSSCHLTHEGTGPFMWARLLGGKEQALAEICQCCHKKDECGEKSPFPETGHPIGIKSREKEKFAGFPLYNSNGGKNSSGEIYCSSCHNSHQWDPVNPDNKGKKDDKGDISNSFLRESNAGSNLCLRCHKEQTAIDKTDHDLLNSSPETKNRLGQTPKESGLCGACHIAHGGSKRYMWARELDEKKDKFIVQICVECHSDESCAKDSQISKNSHSVGISLKDQVETSLPLFAQDGAKEPEGMVFCSTCHDPHQWNNKDPAIKGKDGTVFDSFLRINADRNSPLCVECHNDKKYIEATDHDLRVTAPCEKNNQGLLPDESGLCLQCHSVHNALSKVFILNRELGPVRVLDWNEEFASSDSIMTGVCTSCHQENQCAGDKIPEFGLHPSRLYMALIRKNEDIMDRKQFENFIGQFPVYSDDGKKSIDGNIVCSTCHDTHVWDARHPATGSGDVIEGNAISSFLRKGIPNALCSSCHGEEGLYKFKYFHKLKSRLKDKNLIPKED